MDRISCRLCTVQKFKPDLLYLGFGRSMFAENDGGNLLMFAVIYFEGLIQNAALNFVCASYVVVLEMRQIYFDGDSCQIYS